MGQASPMSNGSACTAWIPPAPPAVPFGALKKNEWGAVTWTSSLCIGCRYCEVSCPFDVPKFEWDKWNPENRQV